MESSSSPSTTPSSSSYIDAEGRSQPLLPLVVDLLTLTSTPYSATRLPATITAHSAPVTLLKTRKLLLLNKLKAKVLAKGHDSDWTAVESHLHRLSADGAPVDRLITIVSYISETQSKPTTTTSSSSTTTHPPPSTSTPLPHRSPPRPVSAQSSSSSASTTTTSRSLQSTPAPVLSAPSSPQPALSAPTSLSGRISAATATATSSRAMALLSAEPTPARPTRQSTPKPPDTAMGRGERGTERRTERKGGGREAGDEKERRHGWEDEELHSSTALPPLPSTSDAVDIRYGDEVSLQLPSLLYVSPDPDFLPPSPPSPSPPTSPTPPPIVRLHPLSPFPFSFVLINAKTPSDRSPVRFLDSVSLSADGLFVTLSPHGVLGLTASPTPSSRFTLYSGKPSSASTSLSSLSFLSVRGCVQHGEVAILKGSTGLYLTDEEGLLTLLERPALTSLLTVRRANLPLSTPDIARILTSHLIPSASTSSTSSAPFSSQSIYQQEGHLTADLLYALVGVDGQWVARLTPAASQLGRFALSAEVTDVSLRSLVARVLPLCDQYVQLRSYIAVHDHYEYGCVQHAMVGSLSLLLREYEVMVASLSSQPHLSLTQLSYHLSSPASTFLHLSSVLSQTAHQVGGAVLTVLHAALLSSGDPTHRSLLTLLLHSASIPYLSLLSSWLYCGSFSDPYHEFLIRSNSSVSSSHLHSAFNDSYWDSRWSVEAVNAPPFIAGLTERILVTGKYLNVIRECGQQGEMPMEGRLPLPYSSQSRDYAQVVEAAYSWASRALLSLLLGEYRLVSHLHSMQSFFFLAQGDWFVHFLDIAEVELAKPYYHTQRTQLQPLLALALKASRAAHDPHHELLTCYLQPHSLLQKIEAISRVGAGGAKVSSSADPSAQPITGLDAFTLSYDVTYPLSLLLSRTALTKYALLFRLLFNLKVTERALSSSWKCARRHRLPRQHSAWRTAAALHQLRSQMTAFIVALLHHFTMHVLEPRYRDMRKAIDAAHSVDDVITVHAAYVDACLRECMVTDGALLGLLDGCVDRCKAVTRLHVEEAESEAGVQSEDAGPRLCTPGAHSRRRLRRGSGEAEEGVERKDHHSV